MNACVILHNLLITSDNIYNAFIILYCIYYAYIENLRYNWTNFVLRRLSKGGNLNHDVDMLSNKRSEIEDYNIRPRAFK